MSAFTRTIPLVSLEHVPFFGSELDWEFRVTVDIEGSESRHSLKPWADTVCAEVWKIEVRRHDSGDWHDLPLALVPHLILRRIAEEQESEAELEMAELS